MIYLAAILFALACALLGGYALVSIDSVAPPPGHTGHNPRLPLRGLCSPSGKERELQAAPHRGRLVAWGGSIFGGRR